MQGDVIVDKENVGPRGSAAWSQQAMLAKNRGLGAGHDAARKEKYGVLASNATTNNGGGGGGSLELLKERVKLLKLSCANGESGESDSRLLKHRSPLVEIRSSEGTVNSVGNLSSKDGMGHSIAQERSSSQSQEIPSFQKLPHSRANASEQSERNVRSSLHSSGGHVGPKSQWPGTLKVLELYQEESAKSRDRREVCRSRVEAWVNAVGHTPEQRVLTSLGGSVSEQQVETGRSSGTSHTLESKTVEPRSSSTSRGSGGWSGAQRQGTPYKRRLPLSKEEKVGKTIHDDEAQRKNNELRVADHIPSASAVSLDSPQPKEVESFELREKEKNAGGRKTTEENLKYFDSLSMDRVSQGWISGCYGSGILKTAEMRSGFLADIGRRGPSEKKISFPEDIRLTQSSGVWGHSEPGLSPEDQREKESSKWALSHANTDATTFAPSSSFLLSQMTGTSSSGSSATPGLSGGSSIDDDTVGYLESLKQQTPFSKEHVIPPSRERMSSRTRIKKRLKALGPASRLLISGPALRVAVKDDGTCAPRDNGSPNSGSLSPEVRSSPLEKGVATGLEALSPVTPEDALICPDPDLLGDFKKRKAEDDPSVGDVSQGENECSTDNKSPYDKGIKSALVSTRDLLKDTPRSHFLGLNSHRSIPDLEKVEGNGTRHPTHQRGAESTSGVVSQLGKTTSLPYMNFEWAPNSKGVSKKLEDISTAASKLSRGAMDKPYSDLGLSRNFNDMVSLQEGQLLDREVAAAKQPIDGAGNSINLSVNSLLTRPKNSPSSDARGISSEREEIRISSVKKADSDGREVSEAVSMSQDGLCPRDKSDTRPGSVHDLSNSLGSLSLGERDVPTRTRSPLQILVNTTASNPPLTSVNQSSIKSLENFSVFPNTSHSSGKSAVTAENEPPIRQSRSSPSEAARKELSGAQKENQLDEPKVEASLEPAPSERAEEAASNVPRPSEGPRKEDGKASSVATQRKVLEDEKFFWVNDERYQKLGMIGKGGSSQVYKVIDSEFSIYALKKIILGGRDHSTALGFYQEIEYLERLRGKRHIVQLIDYEVTNKFVVDENYGEEKIQEDACIYMVLEFGEIDLAGILSKKRKEMLESNEPLDDNWIRFYWKHMLSAVKTIHDERIVHADLKPANFLLVKGELKLIDFGIAKAIQTDTTHVVRDSQVGTLNYMPPEALMNNSKDDDGRVFKCGRSSDIWSLGCILYQMVYGHTPYSHIRTMFGKIQAITSKSFKIDYPPIRDAWLLDVMKRCLTWDRHSRPDIVQLLVHPFLRPDLAPHK